MQYTDTDYDRIDSDEENILNELRGGAFTNSLKKFGQSLKVRKDEYTKKLSKFKPTKCDGIPEIFDFPSTDDPKYSAELKKYKACAADLRKSESDSLRVEGILPCENFNFYAHNQKACDKKIAEYYKGFSKNKEAMAKSQLREAARKSKADYFATGFSEELQGSKIAQRHAKQGKRFEKSTLELSCLEIVIDSQFNLFSNKMDGEAAINIAKKALSATKTSFKLRDYLGLLYAYNKFAKGKSAGSFVEMTELALPSNLLRVVGGQSKVNKALIGKSTEEKRANCLDSNKTENVSIKAKLLDLPVITDARIKSMANEIMLKK